MSSWRFSSPVLIGDVVDGRLARALNATSSLGAQLDSNCRHPPVPRRGRRHRGVSRRGHQQARSRLHLVPSAWIGENLVVLWRYGRLSSFHTYLSRAAAVAMGLFVGALFVVGEQPALLFAAAGLVLMATLEEFLLMWLLPEWTADVRGCIGSSRKGARPVRRWRTRAEDPRPMLARISGVRACPASPPGAGGPERFDSWSTPTSTLTVHKRSLSTSTTPPDASLAASVTLSAASGQRLVRFNDAGRHASVVRHQVTDHRDRRPGGRPGNSAAGQMPQHVAPGRATDFTC